MIPTADRAERQKHMCGWGGSSSNSSRLFSIVLMVAILCFSRLHATSLLKESSSSTKKTTTASTQLRSSSTKTMVHEKSKVAMMLELDVMTTKHNDGYQMVADDDDEDGDDATDEDVINARKNTENGSEHEDDKDVNDGSSKVAIADNDTETAADDEHEKHVTPTTSACRYEDADGSFPPAETLEDFHWDQWTHDNPKDCPMSNHVDRLLGFEEKNNDNRSFPTPLLILIFGDSLDEHMVQFLCQTGEKRDWRMRTLPPFDHPDPRIVQLAVNEYCTNADESIAVIRIPIYGMARACTNGGYLPAFEDSLFASSADRIRTVVPGSVLAHLNHDHVVVLASSSLWDLSAGCNDGTTVTDEYAAEYRQGVVDVAEAIHAILPAAPVYWRTSPRISPEYNAKSLRKGRGRTLDNQQVLNGLLKETVAKQDLGVVVDWWSQLQEIPDAVIQQELPDGRHYSRAPSVAFFNLFLHALVDHDPEFLSSSWTAPA